MLYNSVSDYFSLPNVFDIFGNKVYSELLPINIQFYLNLDTELLSSTLSLNNSVNLNFNNDLLMPNKGLLNDITTNLLNEIEFLSIPKNNAEKMSNIFPEHRNNIEIIEILSLDTNTSYLQNLSTPDFKLYYPEPFVASPSFIHEEV